MYPSQFRLRAQSAVENSPNKTVQCPGLDASASDNLPPSNSTRRKDLPYTRNCGAKIGRQYGCWQLLSKDGLGFLTRNGFNSYLGKPCLLSVLPCICLTRTKTQGRVPFFDKYACRPAQPLLSGVNYRVVMTPSLSSANSTSKTTNRIEKGNGGTPMKPFATVRRGGFYRAKAS